MSGRKSSRPTPLSWGVNSLAVAEERRHPRLIDRDPVRNAVTQTVRRYVGVVNKGIDSIPIRPATETF